MDTLELGALVTLIVTNIVSPIVTWMLAKKRYYTEVDANNIENMQKLISNLQESLNFYKDVCDSNREQLAEIRASHNEYKNAREREADQMRAEIKELRTEQIAMYQLMCMDLPCKFRQPYLSQGDEMIMPSDELHKKIDELKKHRRTMKGTPSEGSRKKEDNSIKTTEDGGDN